MINNLLRIAAVLLMCSSAVIFTWTLHDFKPYADAAHGYVIPMENHGKMLYANELDSIVIRFVWWMPFAVGAILMAIFRRRRRAADRPA